MAQKNLFVPIMLQQQTVTITDHDRDAMHVLPLAIIPLKTPALLRARMVKNLHLNSAIELFTDDRAGSGQIDIDAVAGEFGWERNPPHPDVVTLQRLAILPSFDVYSLRILLRQNGIPVNDVHALRLSEAKQAELVDYMQAFTRPLIAQVYGTESGQFERLEDLLALFRDPDVDRARRRLMMLADKLGIRLTQLPRFLEEFGDVFLSMSYFRSSLDRRLGAVADFRRSLSELTAIWELRQNPALLRTCQTVEAVLSSAIAGVSEQFTSFGQASENLWADISAEHFREIRRLVINSHTKMGGLLCALTVKIDGWAAEFPNQEAGGPKRRLDFIVTEMRPGIERLRKLESSLGHLYVPH